jgi:hypothetical protein
MEQGSIEAAIRPKNRIPSTHQQLRLRASLGRAEKDPETPIEAARAPQGG